MVVRSAEALAIRMAACSAENSDSLREQKLDVLTAGLSDFSLVDS